jgi:hypothetical protein
MEHTDLGRLFETPLTTEAVIAILANDLPHMTEAQLAELMMNFYLDGPSPVADAIVPLARREIAQRRFIAQVEGIIASV